MLLERVFKKTRKHPFKSSLQGKFSKASLQSKKSRNRRNVFNATFYRKKDLKHYFCDDKDIFQISKNIPYYTTTLHLSFAYQLNKPMQNDGEGMQRNWIWNQGADDCADNKWCWFGLDITHSRFLSIHSTPAGGWLGISKRYCLSTPGLEYRRSTGIGCMIRGLCKLVEKRVCATVECTVCVMCVCMIPARFHNNAASLPAYWFPLKRRADVPYPFHFDSHF